MTGFDADAAGGQNNVVISRTMAMMHLAVHDALNAIDRRYEPYLYQDEAEPSADARSCHCGSGPRRPGRR